MHADVHSIGVGVSVVFQSDLGHLSELGECELLLNCLQVTGLLLLQQHEHVLGTRTDVLLFVQAGFNHEVRPGTRVLRHLQGQVDG